MKPIIGITSERTSTPDSPPCCSSVATAYSDAILAAGGAPILIPLYSGQDSSALRATVDVMDGILLAGGEDVHPAAYNAAAHPRLGTTNETRDAQELELIRLAVKYSKPLFGICRGLQVINVALGGTLYQDIASELPGAHPHAQEDMPEAWHRLVHDIRIEPQSRLAGLLGIQTLPVNSLHHQAIRDLASGLTASAHASDGIIEGIEMPAHPFFLAVQCHPEMLVTTAPLPWMKLFEALVRAAAPRAA